MIISLKP